MRKLALGFALLGLAAGCGDDSETDGSGGQGGAPSTTSATKSSSSGSPTSSSGMQASNSSSSGMSTASSSGSTTAATTNASTSVASTSVASTSVASTSVSTTGVTTTGVTTASVSGSTAASTSTGGTPMIDTCLELCAGIVPIEQALGCTPVPGCETGCEDFLLQSNCDAEYFLFVDCALQLPTSAFDCDPAGLVYLGPGCEAELDAFFLCEGV